MKTTEYRLLSVIFLMSIACFQSCGVVDGPCERGRGDVAKRQLEVESFKGVNMTMAGNVTIEKGEELKVEVEGQPNILDLINTSVESEVWTIYPTSCVSNYKNFNVYITVPELTGVTLTGSGTISTSGAFEDDIDILLSGSGKIVYAGTSAKASVTLSGSGKIEFSGDYADLTVSDSGSGGVVLLGSTDFLKVTCSGSGGVDAFGMVATTAKVINSGSGSTRVQVIDELEAVLTGSGSIFYKGNPIFNPEPIDTGSGQIVDSN